MGQRLTLPPTDLFIDGAGDEASGDDADDVVNPATEERVAVVGRGTGARRRRDRCGANGVRRRAWGRGTAGSGPSPPTAPRGARLALDGSPMSSSRRSAPPRRDRSHQVGLPSSTSRSGPTWPNDRELVPYPPSDAAADGSAWLGSWVVRREPVGVVAAITAYNFPFLLDIMKIGPALAAGNTVVLKPSPYTPLSALYRGSRRRCRTAARRR